MNSDQSKWDYICQNGLKRTQKNSKYYQNDPIWAQNGPKWAQMSKSKNELKIA